MKEEVLKLLLEAEDFLSGEEISEQLNVSRTAVWKDIKKLRESGYEIKSVTNRGYRIVTHPDHFVKEELVHGLKGLDLIQEVFIYDTIDSTNQEAKRKAASEPIESALLISEEQTLGKGRRGRQWISESGAGIYMSLLLRPQIQPANASMLTLITGLAVQKGIATVTGLHTQIKWPNDLVLNKKKVCGILTEMSTEMDLIHYIIIGIGINVNGMNFAPEIKEMATSLALEGGKTISRQELVIAILNAFEGLYTTFCQRESLDFILEDYNAVCVNVGKEVRVEMNGKTITGEALGLQPDGTLLLKTPSNDQLTIHAGEVSVRGLYGYVD